MSDLVGGVLVIALAAAVYLLSLGLPPSFGYGPGSALFPQITAGCTALLGLLMVVRYFRTSRQQKESTSSQVTQDVEHVNVWRLSALTVLCGLYAGMMEPLGFVTSSFLFLLLVMLLLGERRRLVLFLFPAGLSGVVFYLFKVLLGVQLPSGALL